MTPDPGWFRHLVRAIRVRTHLQFFALVVVLVWVMCMAGLQRGGLEGLLVFGAAFLWLAVVTVLGARTKQ